MIREYEETKTVKKYKKFCDVCNEKIKIDLACSVAKCEICGRDLCQKCIGHECPSYGDYRVVYCQSCWDAGEKIRQEIEELNKRKDELCHNWKLTSIALIEYAKSGLPWAYYCKNGYGDDEMVIDCVHFYLAVNNKDVCNVNCPYFYPKEMEGEDD